MSADVEDKATTADPVVIVEYRSEWAERFAELLDAFNSELGPRALRIEHIGSTSIPGMAAKDVLDVQISVADLGTAEKAFARPLAELGFEQLPYTQDHVPAGNNDDPSRWQKKYWQRRGHPDGDVNLHVRLSGSSNERLALLFRDWLRRQPSAVAAYARFKTMLALAVADPGDYTDVKDPVVDMVFAMATEWAQATGWRP